MAKVRKFLIYDPVYKFDWMIVVGGSLQSAINRYAKAIKETPWQVDDIKKRDGHFTTHTAHRNGMIWFREQKPAFSIVAHECLHAVVYFAEKMEIAISEKTEEVFTYYLQWLVKRIGEKI